MSLMLNAVCRYCDSRRKVLLDHVREGYDKDLWDCMDVAN